MDRFIEIVVRWDGLTQALVFIAVLVLLAFVLVKAWESLLDFCFRLVRGYPPRPLPPPIPPPAPPKSRDAEVIDAFSAGLEKLWEAIPRPQIESQIVNIINTYAKACREQLNVKGIPDGQRPAAVQPVSGEGKINPKTDPGSR